MSKNTNQEKDMPIVYPRFIGNDPLGEDLFEGKSHERIADTIIEQIKQNYGKIIGLEGKWGSGKSNVIEIIKKKTAEKGLLFFLYNVWLHQEDLHRRVIPIELYQYLVKEKMFKASNQKDGLEKKLNDILGNSTETIITKKPRLSAGALVVILTVFLTSFLPPFAAILLDKDKISMGCYFLISLISILPVVILLLCFLICEIQKWRSDRAQKSKFRSVFSNTFSRFITVYQDKEVDNAYTTYTKEKNPSLEDFQSFITSISKKLNKSKLIIVFDDIDRIEPDRIFDFWGIMHNLFSGNIFKNIKIIVPFDREHINAIFSDAESKKGNDYISKSFDVIYRVSPPILSDYKKFMKKKWTEAFSDTVQENEYNYILQIFDLMCKEKSPRNIISFINEFVSLKQTNNYRVPERYICLFLMKKDKILSDPEKQIVSRGFLGSLAASYDNEETSKYIASLVYQIDPDNALEILYKDKLRIAIDHSDLKQLEKIGKFPSFVELFHSALPECSSIENVIVSVDHLFENALSENPMHDQIWKDIYEQAMGKKEKLEIDTEDCLPYQSKILKHIDDDEKTDFMKFVLHKVHRSENFSSVGYYKIVKRFKETLGIASAPLDTLLQDHREIEVGQFISLIEFAKNDYLSVNLLCPLGILDNYLASKKLEELEGLRFVKYIKEKYELVTYTASLKQMFAAHISNHTSLISIISCLKDIDETIDTSSIPTNVLQNMYNYTLKTDFHYDMIAIRLANPQKNDSYMSLFEPILKEEKPDENKVKRISEVLWYYINFGEFLTNVSQMSQFPLYCSVLKYILQNKLANRANIIKLLKYFQTVCEKIDIEPEIVLENYNNWSSYLEKDTDFFSDIENNLSIVLIRACMKSKTGIAKYILKRIKSFFDEFDKETWESCFKNPDGYNFEVILLTSVCL